MRQYPFTLNATDLIIILGEVKEEGSRDETLDKPHPSALFRLDRVHVCVAQMWNSGFSEGVFLTAPVAWSRCFCRSAINNDPILQLQDRGVDYLHNG